MNSTQVRIDTASCLLALRMDKKPGCGEGMRGQGGKCVPAQKRPSFSERQAKEMKNDPDLPGKTKSVLSPLASGAIHYALRGNPSAAIETVVGQLAAQEYARASANRQYKRNAKKGKASRSILQVAKTALGAGAVNLAARAGTGLTIAGGKAAYKAAKAGYGKAKEKARERYGADNERVVDVRATEVPDDEPLKLKASKPLLNASKS